MEEREDKTKEGNRGGLCELELECVYAQEKDLEERRAEGVGESRLPGGRGWLEPEEDSITYKMREGSLWGVFSVFFHSLSDSGGKTISWDVGGEGVLEMAGQRRSHMAVAWEGRRGGPGMHAWNVQASGVSGKHQAARRAQSPATCLRATSLRAPAGGPGNAAWTDVQLGDGIASCGSGSGRRNVPSKPQASKTGLTSLGKLPCLHTQTACVGRGAFSSLALGWSYEVP